MIGGKACVTDELKALVSHLHSVVLIININYDEAARKTAHFLRAVYGRFFDHVVLIGPNELPDLGVEGEARSPQSFPPLLAFTCWTFSPQALLPLLPLCDK